MSRIRLAVGVAVVAAAVTVSAPAPAQPSTTEEVKSWTQKEWNAAKHEYGKNKAKWDACNKRATERHLTGRKSWSFIYDCMKS